jgi:hypothetical protein
MTGRAQGLEVVPVPEEPRISLVLADVVDLEHQGHLATLGASVGLVDAHLLAEVGPPSGVVPATHIPVDADRMPGAVPTGNVDGTARLRTVGGRAVHGRDLEARKMTTAMPNRISARFCILVRVHR